MKSLKYQQSTQQPRNSSIYWYYTLQYKIKNKKIQNPFLNFSGTKWNDQIFTYPPFGSQENRGKKKPSCFPTQNFQFSSIFPAVSRKSKGGLTLHQTRSEKMIKGKGPVKAIPGWFLKGYVPNRSRHPSRFRVEPDLEIWFCMNHCKFRRFNSFTESKTTEDADQHQRQPWLLHLSLMQKLTSAWDYEPWVWAFVPHRKNKRTDNPRIRYKIGT